MNPRNVVLCLLEVARIACTRYQFSPAPGLVELEQEIEREIQQELQELSQNPTEQRVLYEYVESEHARRVDNVEVPSSRSRVSRKLWSEEEEEEEEESGESEPSQSPVQLVINGDTTEDSVVNGFRPEVDLEGKEDSDTGSKDCGFVDNDSGSYSSTDASDTMRRSPSSNSVLSSASSTYLESGGTCGNGEGSSTTSSTPIPMTSELDHKVSLC